MWFRLPFLIKGLESIPGFHTGFSERGDQMISTHPISTWLWLQCFSGVITTIVTYVHAVLSPYENCAEGGGEEIFKRGGGGGGSPCMNP